MKLPQKLIWPIFLVIFIIGVTLRFLGFNWDQDQHLHPDERFLTMVGQNLHWPTSLSQYFSTANSPANPHNFGFPFYVYGTFPLFLTKITAQLVHFDTYNGITLVGRGLSAILDSSLIVIVYLISCRLYKNKIIGLISALFFCLSALPIQLAHFFTVDTFLVFFLYFSFYFLHRVVGSAGLRSIALNSLGLGLTFGLALSSKISAVIFLPVIIVGFCYLFYLRRSFRDLILLCLVFIVSTVLMLRVTQPYLFTGLYSPNPKVLSNWQQLKSFDDKSGWYPPAVQWINTAPLIFPLENIFLWGLGPVLSIAALFSLVLSVRRLKSHPEVGLHLLWIIGLFIYQGVQLAKPMRYLYPIYPSLAIISGPILYRLLTKKPLFFRVFIIILIFCWPIAFVSIYTRPHSRVTASDWINTHIPEGSTISCEYWDDCLPLVGGERYRSVSLSLYDPESQTKWMDIQAKLSRIDYLILTSNRLYGSIMSVPDKYPVTVKFYSDLFAGRLGFTKIAQFTSRPNLPFPGLHVCFTPPFISYGKVARISQECPLSGISFIDDYADESWTVYDHPKVIIFSRQSPPN